MKAIGLDTYGGPDVLHQVDLPDPHPGPGEVRIQVHATAVAPVDMLLRTGVLAGAYSGLRPPFVPGMEVAGVVDEIGPGIDPASDLAIGTAVVAFVDFTGAHGGYSDFVVLPAASLTRAPDGATFPEAASFLNNALTARNALDTLALEAGSTLLVTGAAGSVGGYLTQLGTHEGLRVVAIAAKDDDHRLLPPPTGRHQQPSRWLPCPPPRPAAAGVLSAQQHHRRLDSPLTRPTGHTLRPPDVPPRQGLARTRRLPQPAWSQAANGTPGQPSLPLLHRPTQPYRFRGHHPLARPRPPLHATSALDPLHS